MFQKFIGLLLTILSVFMLTAKENVTNPEFLWVLLILGIIFILIPINIFEKER